jgi:hypothetical protein
MDDLLPRAGFIYRGWPWTEKHKPTQVNPTIYLFGLLVAGGAAARTQIQSSLRRVEPAFGGESERIIERTAKRCQGKRFCAVVSANVAACMDTKNVKDGAASNKAVPKSADEHLKPASRESTVDPCVLQPCLESLPLYFLQRACYLLSSNRQPRHRRRMRLPKASRPRNNRHRRKPARRNHQIRARRLPRMSRRSQLRRSRPRRSRPRRSRRLRHSHRQVILGNKRRRPLELVRTRKRRHGRSSMSLALAIERSVVPWRSAFWG